MSDIERRARHNLFLFTLRHPERYSSLAGYRSASADFQVLVRDLLPDGWILSDGVGIWCMARPPVDRTPEAGFKIHLSATDESAKELLSAVVPILAAEGAAFKFVADRFLLDIQNSSSRDRGSCGKFITAYPGSPDRFRPLMERLHEATKGFAGPYILSDKRYEGSRVLFYRYGAFKDRSRLNVFGERQHLLVSDGGRLIQDRRLPYFFLPEGIADPYPSATADAAEPVLKGRYRATHMMGTSSKGGIYRCTDLETGAEVVVKEGRPFVNRGRFRPYDAVDCLKKEHEILSLLEGTGVTPRALDFFEEWENGFLVMELVPGGSIADHLASGELSKLFKKELSAAEVRRFCENFLAMARRFIAGVHAIHARGVVIQDLAPQNVLFDRDRWRITFVDFEAAHAARGGDDRVMSYFYTPGFGDATRRPGEPPNIAGDYLALSRLLGDLIYPVARFFALAPERRAPMLEHFAKEKGIPAAFLRLIHGVGDQPERIGALLEEAEQSLADITAPGVVPPLRRDDELRGILDRIASYIVDQIPRGDGALDLPTDYRRFNTNGLSVAFGASGIACFLKRVTGEVPAAMLDALAAEVRRVDNDRYPPGLYMGTSGVAWALLDLGLRSEAEGLMKVAAQSPLRSESADLFYGAAGQGLANLYFFDELGDEEYLANAVEAFDTIKPRLSRAPTGYFHENVGDVYHGIAHGAAGIAYFMLRLYQATLRLEHLEHATGLLDFELASAEERSGQMVFRRCAREPVFFPYWRTGGAGIGSVALRFHEVVGEARYVEAARRLADGLQGVYSAMPANFTGMAGLGNFFVDMHRATADDGYLEEARRFVDRIMLFVLERPSGIVFPGEELLRASTDYGTGSAGTGAFIHRILTGAGIPFFDFR